MNTISVKNLNLQNKFKPNNNRVNKNDNSNYLSILKNVSVNFKSGCLNAIMGPSGSGKTTFMKTLYGICDKSTKTSGEILFNGEERDLKSWFEISCFSEQDGYTIENTTVRDAIDFVIGLDDNNNLLDFDTIIKNMQLGDVLDSNINVISGGERKRTMVALDLIQNKKVILIDELTSGLDTHSAYKIVKFLHDMAINNDLLLIMSFHQPSSKLFELFGTLTFFHHGHCIYNDVACGMEEFLKSHGWEKPENITIQEFIFEIFSVSSSFENIERMRPRVNEFMSKLEAESTKNDSVLVNSTTSYGIGVLKISEIYSLLRRQVSKIFGLEFYFLIAFFVLIGGFEIYSAIKIINKFNDIEIVGLNDVESESDLEFEMLWVGCIIDLFDTLRIFSHNIRLKAGIVQFKKEIQKGYYSIFSFCVFEFIFELFLNSIFATLRFAPMIIIHGIKCFKPLYMCLFVLAPIIYTISSCFCTSIEFALNGSNFLQRLFLMLKLASAFQLIFVDIIMSYFDLLIMKNALYNILLYLYVAVSIILSVHIMFFEIFLWFNINLESTRLLKVFLKKIIDFKLFTVAFITSLLGIVLVFSIAIFWFTLTDHIRLQHKKK